MKAQGIGIGVHYPAMHLFSLYRRNWAGSAGRVPAGRAHRRVATVTLPLFPAMRDADVERVCQPP
jgi:dTDP-4-amino-4,6-dideoxygalactose transaminase